MAKRVVNESSLTSVADAIRDKSGTTSSLVFPEGFISAIGSITPGEGGITPNGTINITTNGIHDVTSFASANVNVPTSGGDIVNGDDIEVGNLSELHAWSKYTIGGTIIEEPVTDVQLFWKMASSSATFEIDYADSYEIVDNAISLVNPTTITLGSDTASRNAIKGKYVKRGGVYYIPSDARVAYGNYTTNKTIEVDKATKITYTAADGDFVCLVVSEDSNAYPQNGEQDGYKYVYNGTLDSGSCDHTAVTQATPTITVNATTGVITASSTQSAGLVSAGTKSATKQITHTNLTAANIKSGVSIFGITGSYSGSGGSGVELPTFTRPPATEANVVSGKQFIDESGNLRTGSMGLLGFGGIVDANEDVEIAENDDGSKTLVVGGYTKNTETNRVEPETPIIVTLTDTHEAMSVFGNATEDDVRAGKTFTSAAGFVKTGRATMGSGSTELPKLDGAYVWQKCTVDNGWNYTTEDLGTTAPSGVSGTGKRSFTITEDGYFELSAETAALGGYYSISGSNGKSIYSSTWHYASSGSYYTYSKLTLTNSKEDTKGQPVSCVTSDSENAYPDNGVSNGYWYVKLVAVDAA
jgi:hypothetical protein